MEEEGKVSEATKQADHIENLEEQLRDARAHITYSYSALGDVSKSIYLFDHIANLKKKSEEALAWKKPIQELLFALGMKEEMTNWGGDLNGWGAAFEWIKYHIKRSQDLAKKEKVEKRMSRKEWLQCGIDLGSKEAAELMKAEFPEG